MELYLVTGINLKTMKESFIFVLGKDFLKAKKLVEEKETFSVETIQIIANNELENLIIDDT